jgi:YegS C-terminal NAD kinase beta sandwich-like domain
VIQRGEQWGTPARGAPEVSVHGGDAALAVAARTRPGARVRFVPDPTSDLARAVGINAASPGGTDLPIDAMRLGDGSIGVNMVVLGVAPSRVRWWHRRRPCTVEVDGDVAFDGRATTVLVANGEYLRGDDVVPRGHPGDGRLEVHVHSLAPGDRSRMRRRLRTGTHLPHPAIHTLQARGVQVLWGRPEPLEVDGQRRAPTTRLEATVEPGALTLVV